MINRATTTFVCLLCTLTMYGQQEDKVILNEANVENAYPRLSNDKKKILYQSNRTGHWQLYIMDISSGKQERLTNDEHDNNFPDWSADNKYVAFVSTRDSNEELYIMKTDGSNMRRLTNDKARDIHPYFSPDGKYLLFNSTRGNGSLDIFRYELATGKTEQLTNTADHETCARYSKDMKKIVFLRNNDESDDVYMLDLSNGLVENISKTPYIMDGWPMFSSNGDHVYYSSLNEGKYSIYKLTLKDGSKQQLTDARPNEEHARVYVSADDSMMIYNKRVGKTIEIRGKEL